MNSPVPAVPAQAEQRPSTGASMSDLNGQLGQAPGSRSLTFLFTDIEGSTQLWEQHAEAMKHALTRHDAILRRAIKTHHGHIFKTFGDSFYSVFFDVSDALMAALTAQQALQSEAWGETPIKVRMALHTGIAQMRDGDYFGPPLNRTARLLSAGHGGQILLSAITSELLQSHLPADTELRDMGEWRLKDLTRPEHIYQLLSPNLPSQFPPLKTLDTFHTNLPAQLTSFVGREKEMNAVKNLMAEYRLTTLTGSGGAGKTRLSLQVASDLLDTFPDGVWFVEFAPLADPSLLTQTVLSTLGLREEVGRPLLEVLTDYLTAKTALLILDNCEHVIEASAQLAESLLHACPNLRMIVSSREALGIPGEAAYRVPSLSLPDKHLAYSSETVRQSEAARLFLDRAQTALPGFAITDENASAIAQICTQLDGIPLAIELAAARVKMLKVEQIAERLNDRFHLLTGGSRTALPRQQTLRAMIDWSYDLLPESERTLLRRLSVFAGGWTLEAAEQVCSAKDEIRSQKDEGRNTKDEVRRMKDEETLLLNFLHPSDFIIHPSDVLDLLAQLVNKSLVVMDADIAAGQGKTETRYRLLETVRQYAREKLFATGEGALIHDLHLQYFLELAERAELKLIGPQVVEWLQRLEAELDNIRAALEWSLKQDAQLGVRIVVALFRFWMEGGYFYDAGNWLTLLLQQPATSSRNAARARALTVLGFLQNGGTPGQLFAQQALAIYRELEDERGIAEALCLLGAALSIQDDFTAGRPIMRESLARFRAIGDRKGIFRALDWLGSLVDDQDYEQTHAYLEESLGMAREMGDPIFIANHLGTLSRLAFRRGDFSAARAYLTEALAIQHHLGRSNADVVLERLGELALREGDYAQARPYLEESLARARKGGRLIISYWMLAHLAYVALRQGDWARARSLFIEAQKNFKEAALKIGVVYTVEGLANLAVQQNQANQAARLIAWADVTRDVIGDHRPPIEQADVDRDLASIQAQLDEAAFAAAQEAGRAMSMDEAVAYAIEATQ